MKRRATLTNAQRQALSYGVALDEFPEFAACVGILISCFAMIESYVHQVISIPEPGAAAAHAREHAPLA